MIYYYYNILKVSSSSMACEIVRLGGQAFPPKGGKSLGPVRFSVKSCEKVTGKGIPWAGLLEITGLVTGISQVC